MLIELIKMYDDVIIPTYAKQNDAGFDFRSYIDMTVPPKQLVIIPTGIKVNVPQGYELQVRSRSGLAFKHQIFVLNSPGTVDSGYQDEIKVLLYNLGNESFEIKKHDRIAQGVFNQIIQGDFLLVEKFIDSYNRNSGFGGTGVK